MGSREEEGMGEGLGGECGEGFEERGGMSVDFKRRKRRGKMKKKMFTCVVRVASWASWMSSVTERTKMWLFVNKEKMEKKKQMENKVECRHVPRPVTISIWTQTHSLTISLTKKKIKQEEEVRGTRKNRDLPVSKHR